MLDLAYSQERAFLSILERLVSFESPSHDKAACDRLADHLERLLTGEGWSVERHPRSAAGDILEARFQGVEDGPSTLLLAHYDTVWPVGTLEKMPWRRDGDRVYGPGTVDMKAGITAAIQAVRILSTSGLRPVGPLTLLLTSDEESGSHHSRSHIEELAKEHDRVLVLEMGRDDGAVKIGRKGVGSYRLSFKGRSAHAGNNPEDGASALRELAHFLLFVEELADVDAGTSVNLTVAAGGSVINVISEEAYAQVDVRALETAEAQRVDQAVRGYRPRDERIEIEIDGGPNRPPMEHTPANRRLWEEAQRCADELGLLLEGAIVGGGSDGSFTSALGIATLDGLGCVGSGAHARIEHIRLRETLERMALLAALISGGTGTERQ